jgi:arabinogalactan endo-1,4-beta-galactosidase
MKRRTLTFLLAGCLLLTGCGTVPEKPAVTSDTLRVEKVENLSENFILGMDASCVPSLEKSGVRYYDHNGVEKTSLKF